MTKVEFAGSVEERRKKLAKGLGVTLVDLSREALEAPGEVCSHTVEDKRWQRRSVGKRAAQLWREARGKNVSDLMPKTHTEIPVERSAPALEESRKTPLYEAKESVMGSVAPKSRKRAVYSHAVEDLVERVQYHAVERFQQHHPHLEEYGLLGALRRSWEVSAGVARSVCGRSPGGGAKGDRYFVADDCRGIFVVSASRVLVTYLRMSYSQQNWLREAWPGEP